MSYTVGDIRRWDVFALAGAGNQLSQRGTIVEDVRRNLSDGAASLDEGWDGIAAEAVLDAAEEEKRHVTHLADRLVDLADALARAQAALGPAVKSVKDRIADAEAAGLVVTDVAVEQPVGAVSGGAGADAGQSVVDQHAEAISSAIETVRSLDEHYGREIDGIASQLHSAIPIEVDRSLIPGPGDPWPGRAVDAMTGAASRGLPDFADELDPETRGKHKLNPVPDDFGRPTARGLRVLGKAAGPLGYGLTIYDGVQAHARGETSAREAISETTGALVGGAAGGAAAGAVAGTVFGPVGALIGAGIGAAVGSYLGQKAGDKVHKEIFDE